MSLSFSIGFIVSFTLPGLWSRDLSEKDKRRKRKGYLKRERKGGGNKKEKGREERRVGGREREHHCFWFFVSSCSMEMGFVNPWAGNSSSQAV